MKNLKDDRTKIFPSTTRTGKELPSSSALDSPSVLSKLVTPPPTMNYAMSHAIDDATSAMNMNDAMNDATSALKDTIDDASAMLDTTVPLGEFLDEQLAKVRELERD